MPFQVIFNSLPETLQQMGIKEVYQPADHLITARNALLQLSVIHSEDHLRIQVELLNDAFVNKAMLWHLIHLNTLYAPFGQFYVSAQKQVCLGCNISREHPWLTYWQRIIYEMLSCAESYFSLLNRDLAELPFHEKDLVPDWSELIKSGFFWGKETSPLDRHTATYMLDRLLHDASSNKYQIIRMSESEYALTDDWITHIKLIPLPQIRRYQHVNDWFIGIQTDIGILNHTDTALLIKINRINYDLFGAALTLKYENRNHILYLNTELIADFIQYPAVIQTCLEMHSHLAENLFESFKDTYKLKDILNFNFGIG